MEKMLNEYLQFAKSQFSEKTDRFNISDLIDETIREYKNENITQNLIENIYLNGRKNLIKRCLNNLIDNSLKYSKLLNININKSNNHIIIILDDDGDYFRMIIAFPKFAFPLTLKILHELYQTIIYRQFR